MPTIILNGKTKEPQKDLIGTFGFGSLNYLNGIMKLDQFTDKDSTVKVYKRERNDELVPEMMTFTSNNGNQLSYRFMHESAIPNMPEAKDTEWDIVINPKKNKVDELSQIAGLFAESEEHIIFRTDNGNLIYNIGEENSASHKGKMVFEENVNGELNVFLKWPIAQVLAAFRLSLSGTSEVKFSKKGAICVSIDSGLAVYDIFIVANQK